MLGQVQSLDSFVSGENLRPGFSFRLFFGGGVGFLLLLDETGVIPN